MTRRSAGFTLIESLMVTAIIGLLAALIFAVMGPVREKGRQTICISNLHQIGRAIAMYRADYDGIEAVQGQPTECWQLGLPCSSNLRAFGKIYIKNRDVLLCPDYDGRYGPIEGVWSTYMWLPDDGAGVPRGSRFVDIVERRGEEAPIVVDELHTPNFNLGALPRWASKKVIVLRLNQQVKLRNVAFRDLSMQY